jgi:sugar phosphate permease
VLSLFGRRVYYGWWIVFASATIVFLSAGTFFYGFGALIGPLTDEFGWSRAAVSAAFSLRTEVGGVAAPVVGFAADRIGVRRLVVAGIWVVAAGFVVLSQSQSLLVFYGGVVLIAVGNSAAGGATAAVSIAHWFSRLRGRALGFMTLGGGMGGVMAIAFAWLISEFGWRDALLIVGLSQLALCTPLALSIRDRPSDMGLPVDGFAAESAPTRRESRVLAADEGYTAAQALRSSLFWRVAAVFALSNFATTAIIVHQIPFLTESVHMSQGLAATSLTVMTTISLASRLSFGQAADVFSTRVVTTVALLAVAGSLALFATVREPWQLVYVLPLLGVGFGGMIPVRSVIQAEYFGLRAFGAIQGMTLTVTTLGAFAGPVLAGALYDVSGSYRLAFVLLAMGPLIAVPLILTARPRPAPRLEAVETAL